MCDCIMLPGGEVIETDQELLDHGLEIQDDDYHDGYEIGMTNLCLCAFRVEQILDRADVRYERDPFGWVVKDTSEDLPLETT